MPDVPERLFRVDDGLRPAAYARGYNLPRLGLQEPRGFIETD